MRPIKKLFCRSIRRSKGAAFITSMIFILVFSALAVSMATLSGTNLQISQNQHKANSALSAAESGLECGRFIIAETIPFLDKTSDNYVTETQADMVWSVLCAHVQDQPWVAGQAQVGENEIITPDIYFSSQNPSLNFRVRFYREGTHTIKLDGIGTHGQITKHVTIDTVIKKGNDVLNYAVAGRGRMWLTGESTIHGDVFSSWDRPDISPFNLTSDSRIEGTINTVLTLEEIENEGAFQMETLDENGNPMFDEEGNRIYSPEDEIQGYHEGINYGQPDDTEMPGMDISHYDTDIYYDMVMSGTGGGDIESSATIQTEYFPHAAGDYTQPKSSSSRKLNRHVYENQTFTDQRLPSNSNALFKDCTFEGVLYVDCYKNTSTYYNNVRFENCTFKGVIVTDTPDELKWQNNCLYFTGEATFNNETDIPATILAPHFNVDLGNTNPVQSDNNVLTGAIVGGIVDIRGNAQIYGTIISMCDTTGWSSGYVTNIGATLDDGGSETTEVGDVGVISITPEQDKMLPSGITSPIIIQSLQGTYSEGI